jgi:signal transduction histidine kinase
VVTIVEVNGDVAAELSARAPEVIQMVREALSNVGRHAEATTCRVSLRPDGTGAVLEIDDDGKGFDPDSAPKGDGLDNLRNRAEALGGKASVESSPAEGTTVRIAFPL